MTNSNPTRRSPRSQIRNIRFDQLRNYRLPLAGIVSILHRISGLLLFLCLPLLLWLFDLSLASERSFDHFVQISQSWVTRIVLLALGWALLHHLCAGVRFLLLDLHLGVDRIAAQRSSIAVLAVSGSLTLLFALHVFGVL
ncbi:MAG TPA: succinate dehydrogenase, cytochrome b556 subunit [Burkholderiaceae bacterium]|nr:succinate dehydrogenase, cytochrome b556 subunit [Burkholderiaceae bacterium]HXY22726.1 succinate dehydrogenase, cytochrome b556 subunit [Burkholderiaceae bacterium]HYA59229.1 succinate dehydrogenase, cytochrome b556 subunit [Burkholderiaceae bacterium]